MMDIADSVHDDYTGNLKPKELVRAQRNLAQQYLDIAGVIIVAIDAKERVTLINKKGAEVLGYTEPEIIGKNWFDSFIPERMREDIRSVFRKLMAGDIEPVEYFENPVVTKSGEERLIAWHNAVIRDEGGENH
ncbi:MAG: PAS domain S-box protein [Armatimonadetes bacterium]|nr:PAS domain S-box protein [Armatimonadota bacterium]